MSKKSAFDEKYQIEFCSIGEYSMAQLIAYRLYQFMNEKNNGYQSQKYSFIISSSSKGTTLTLSSNVSEIPEIHFWIVKSLTQTYFEILTPFFKKTTIKFNK